MVLVVGRTHASLNLDLAQESSVFGTSSDDNLLHDHAVLF